MIPLLINNILLNWNPETSDNNKKKTNNKNNFASLHAWLNIGDLDHSNKIKAGIFIHKFIKELVKGSPNQVELIEDNNSMINISSGKKKEMDVLFKIYDVNQNFSIFYREIKNNVNLDSEKRPATFDKIKMITDILKNKYNNASIISGKLTCPTYFDSDDNIESLNDLITILGYSPLTFDQFKELGYKLGEKYRKNIITL